MVPVILNLNAIRCRKIYSQMHKMGNECGLVLEPGEVGKIRKWMKAQSYFSALLPYRLLGLL